MPKRKTGCYDCQRPYGDKHGFPDLIIPNNAWRQISPYGNEGGLLCPSCIVARLAQKKIHCEGAFMSGPIEPVSRTTMQALRTAENCWETLQHHGIHWGPPKKEDTPPGVQLANRES